MSEWDGDDVRVADALESTGASDALRRSVVSVCKPCGVDRVGDLLQAVLCGAAARCAPAVPASERAAVARWAAAVHIERRAPFLAPRPWPAAVSSSAAPPGSPDADVGVDGGRLALGSAAVDAVLAGGLPAGALVELVGESGAGKTQLALQAAVECARAGAHAVYVSTATALPSARLEQMAAARGVPNALAFTIVASCPSLALLQARMQQMPALCAERSPVRLLVIDAVAPLFREEYDAAAEAPERASTLGQFAAYLKWLAAVFHLTVLVLNHVQDCVDEEAPSLQKRPRIAARESGRAGGEDFMDDDDPVYANDLVVDGGIDGRDDGNGDGDDDDEEEVDEEGEEEEEEECEEEDPVRRLRFWTGGRYVRPALGLAWASFVSHRVVLARAAPAETWMHDVLAAAPSSSLKRLREVSVAAELQPPHAPEEPRTSAVPRLLYVQYSPCMVNPSALRCSVRIDARGLDGDVIPAAIG